MNNDVGGGAVIGQAPAEHDTDDELLVASGHSGGVTSSSKKSYQRVVAPTSHGTVRLKSKPKILEEVKEQSTALMEIVIFSVFLSFNLLCLLIGIICYNEGLGTLWMEISGEYEYEYDFGWRKSITVHKGHPGVDFDHSNVYDADLEAAGEFFVLIVSVGAMMIVSLITVKLLDMCCECCSRRTKVVKEKAQERIDNDVESWDAFLFIMLVWYGIFELIYIIAIIAFDFEFIDNCAAYVESIESQFSQNSSYGDFWLTQYECVEGWGMYFQYLNVIMGFTNVILLCFIRKSLNVGHEIDKALKIPNLGSETQGLVNGQNDP